MPGEVNIYTCACEPIPGTQPPALAPYVVSLQGLYGIVTLNGTGVLDISTSGNQINFGLQPGAGLGTVTSVAASSSNSNLVIGGSPIATFGTLTFSLAGALNSISGLATAADKMIYTTAADTYAVTDLSAFARTILDDAAAVDVRSTLGLVIGTNVQAFSQDLSDFVTNASWAGANLTLAGDINAVNANFSGNAGVTGTFGVTGAVTFAGALSVGSVSSGTFSGNGTAITGLSGSNISTGTVAVTVGGTGLVSYTVGDLIYASAGTTLSKLNSVTAGSYLRSAGATTAPVWSTLKLPNSATVGDLLYCNTSNNISNLADVATGNALISGGVGVAPLWGKITSSHTDGSTIASIAAGSNSNITAMTAAITFSNSLFFNSDINVNSQLLDVASSAGNSGDILTSTGTTVVWSNQITMDTLTLNTRLSIEGTITAGGTTGAQTINKPSGTVNFAAAATSVVVTNSLCTTSDRVLATVVTNDTTMKSVSCVTTNGAFTLTANAAATAETAVYWVLIRVS